MFRYVQRVFILHDSHINHLPESKAHSLQSSAVSFLSLLEVPNRTRRLCLVSAFLGMTAKKEDAGKKKASRARPKVAATFSALSLCHI